MTKTVLGLFDDFHKAADTVRDLVEAGFAREHIGLLLHDAAREATTSTTSPAEGSQVVAGVGVGGALGGLTGLVLGLGALTIPGIGPMIAAGPLAATIAGATLGAATGGLVGALSELGVSQVEAKRYAEEVRRGGTLVTLKVDDQAVDRAMDIMRRHGARNIDQQFPQSPQSSTTEAAQPSREGALDPLRDFDDGRVTLKRRS